MWRFGGRETLRHIQIAPLGDGWTVGEATLDNAQFFNRPSDAEAAARSLGVRLADVGDPSQITVRLSGGGCGGRFACSTRESWGRVDP
jgi:hypothetical protein